MNVVVASVLNATGEILACGDVVVHAYCGALWPVHPAISIPIIQDGVPDRIRLYWAPKDITCEYQIRLEQCEEGNAYTLVWSGPVLLGTPMDVGLITTGLRSHPERPQ